VLPGPSEFGAPGSAPCSALGFLLLGVDFSGGNSDSPAISSMLNRHSKGMKHRNILKDKRCNRMCTCLRKTRTERDEAIGKGVK